MKRIALECAAAVLAPRRFTPSDGQKNLPPSSVASYLFRVCFASESFAKRPAAAMCATALPRSLGFARRISGWK